MVFLKATVHGCWLWSKLKQTDTWGLQAKTLPFLSACSHAGRGLSSGLAPGSSANPHHLLCLPQSAAPSGLASYQQGLGCLLDVTVTSLGGAV